MVAERDLSADRLAAMLTEIFSAPADLAARARRAHDLAVPGAAQKLADMVEELAQTHRSAA
jgi:UDP-N-acetylglucosamine:LPS N-acetylglucosamine transferase